MGLLFTNAVCGTNKPPLLFFDGFFNYSFENTLL